MKAFTIKRIEFNDHRAQAHITDLPALIAAHEAGSVGDMRLDFQGGNDLALEVGGVVWTRIGKVYASTTVYMRAADGVTLISVLT